MCAFVNEDSLHTLTGYMLEKVVSFFFGGGGKAKDNSSLFRTEGYCFYCPKTLKNFGVIAERKS